MNDETFDDPIKAIQKVEEIGAAYGIGRDMHVGDTIIGIKGRVGFEAAAPMLIIGATRFLEKYTLSKWQQYWKDQVANWYGMFLHESQYLEPVMRDIEAMLQESSQRNVNGTAILELRPLCFSTVGVERKDDLVKNKFGEYGEMQKGWTAEDAKGFIKVTSTALRVYYKNHKDEENLNNRQEAKTDTSRTGRMLSGVCAGLANFFGLDVSLVRIVYTFATIFTAFAGIPIYIIMLIVIPQEPNRYYRND